MGAHCDLFLPHRCRTFHLSAGIELCVEDCPEAYTGYLPRLVAERHRHRQPAHHDWTHPVQQAAQALDVLDGVLHHLRDSYGCHVRHAEVA